MPVHNAAFENDMAPSPAFHANVKATRGFKAHFVGINTCIDELVHSKNKAAERAQRKNANSFGIQLCQKIAGAIKVEFIAYFVLAVAAL